MIFLSFMMIDLSAQGKVLPQTSPPAVAKASFEKSYPNASKVKWEKENAEYEVSFTSNGKGMSAVYDASGRLKETETTMPVAQLPAPVKSYIAQHYKGHKIKEAAEIKYADGTVNYEAEVNKTDVIFDLSGKFIKEDQD